MPLAGFVCVSLSLHKIHTCMNILSFIVMYTCVYLYRDRYKDGENSKLFILMFNFN